MRRDMNEVSATQAQRHRKTKASWPEGSLCRLDNGPDNAVEQQEGRWFAKKKGKYLPTY